jgi:hypothetical protein
VCIIITAAFLLVAGKNVRRRWAWMWGAWDKYMLPKGPRFFDIV